MRHQVSHGAFMDDNSPAKILQHRSAQVKWDPPSDPREQSVSRDARPAPLDSSEVRDLLNESALEQALERQHKLGVIELTNLIDTYGIDFTIRVVSNIAYGYGIRVTREAVKR